MTLQEIIYQAIVKVIGDLSVDELVTGTVANVTDTKCTVKIEGRPDMLNVSLNAFDAQLDTFVTIVPKAGSLVVAGKLSKNAQQAVVLRCSEVDRLILKIGTTELIVDAGGWDIKRGNESVKKILHDMLLKINQITVTTSAGPSGTPINAADFTAIDNRLNDLFK
jgi:hypothetical protein